MLIQAMATPPETARQVRQWQIMLAVGLAESA
jgi:hypothetical protein